MAEKVFASSTRLIGLLKERICILLTMTSSIVCSPPASALEPVPAISKEKSQLEVCEPIPVMPSAGKLQYKLATVIATEAAKTEARTEARAEAPTEAPADGIPDVMTSRIGPSWSSSGYTATFRYDRAKRQFDAIDSSGRKVEEVKIVQFDQKRVVLQGRRLVGPTGGSQIDRYNGYRQGNKIVGKVKGTWMVFSGESDWEAWW